MHQRLPFLLIVAATATGLHCTGGLLDGGPIVPAIPSANADGANCPPAPYTFDKLQEGTMHAVQEEQNYETDTVDVRAYHRLVIRVNNPLWGSAAEHINFVQPVFADAPEGPFHPAGNPVPLGGRVDVNGPYMRLRYFQVSTGGAQVAYTIHGIRL